MLVVVIGGGAAGMFAAIFAAKSGNKVILIEKNEKLGKKLYITGKGRCNLTNNCDRNTFIDNVVNNPKFLSAAIAAFSPSDTMAFFEKEGLPLKTEQGGRVFPVSDKSSDVISVLQRVLLRENVEIRLNETVKDIISDGERVIKLVTDKNTYVPDATVIASGGAVYPLTGSTGDGYKFAKKLGHTVTEPKPALCSIILSSVYNCKKEGFSLENRSYPIGLSLKNISAKIKNTKTDKVLYEEFGEMLFTDKGVSGPVVLTLSSKINRLNFNELEFIIDLKPALDEKKLDARILRDFAEAGNKMFKNSLDKLLPQSLIPFITELSGINPETKINLITKEERRGLLRLLKNLTFKIAGLAPFSEAIITSGGVSVKEINPKTMRSKLINNLYFAGEVIDTDALTGGFNLQIAFSTAKLLGERLSVENTAEINGKIRNDER